MVVVLKGGINPLNKHEIASTLEALATLLELTGENPFKIQAYHRAARSLETVEGDLKPWIDEGKLTTLPGIGKAIAEKIAILFTTGKLPAYEKLKRSLPEGLLDLLEIPGLGAKRVKEIYEELKIHTIPALKRACNEGKIAELPGFGEKSQAGILDGIIHLESYGKRRLWWEAMEIAKPILEGFHKLSAVKQVELAGSLRRKKETIGDLDFLVASTQPKVVTEWFTTQEWVGSVTAQGETKASVRLTNGMQADLRIVPKEQFAYALLYFTGSKEHNIHLRHLAREKGLSLSEYELASLDEKRKSPLAKRKQVSEATIYKVFGLDEIPPELREDCGEIEAAAAHALPKLVTEKDIRGTFHCHTTESDGRNTLEEMAKGAKAMGWEYLGIADHSKSSIQANGLDEERLLKQVEQISKLNRSKKLGIHLFAGTECDILANGKLDFSDAILEQLDYVVIAIHSRFKLDKKEQTRRLIRAIESPLTTMVAHLTGRLLLQREPYELDIEKVIDAAIANETIIELNAHPKRLDMDWRLWHRASEKGLLCSINPDAHSVDNLQYIRAGVNIARKGWLEKEQILNTRSCAQVARHFNT